MFNEDSNDHYKTLISKKLQIRFGFPSNIYTSPNRIHLGPHLSFAVSDTRPSDVLLKIAPTAPKTYFCDSNRRPFFAVEYNK